MQRGKCGHGEELSRRLHEFSQALTRPRQAVNFEKAFRAFDEDGDGTISKKSVTRQAIERFSKYYES